MVAAGGEPTATSSLTALRGSVVLFRKNSGRVARPSAHLTKMKTSARNMPEKSEENQAQPHCCSQSSVQPSRNGYRCALPIPRSFYVPIKSQECGPEYYKPET